MEQKSLTGATTQVRMDKSKVRPSSSLYQKCIHYSYADEPTPCTFGSSRKETCVECSNLKCYDKEEAKRFGIKKVPFDGLDLAIAIRKKMKRRK